MNDLFESRVSAGVAVLTDSLLMPHPKEGKGSGQIDSGWLSLLHYSQSTLRKYSNLIAIVMINSSVPTGDRRGPDCVGRQRCKRHRKD